MQFNSPSQGNKPLDKSNESYSQGWDTSKNYGNTQQDVSLMHGETMNNQSLVEKFMKDHQDATLEKGAWVPDQKVNKCTKCRKDFTFFYRKHHCRICGNIFCANCTLVKNIVNGNVLQNVRMCEICEGDLNKYNASLKTKTNLLSQDQRDSVVRTSDYPQNDGQQQTSRGAPKNKYFEALQREDLHSVINFPQQLTQQQNEAEDSQPSAEDEKLKAELRRRAADLAGSDQVNMNDYLKGVADESFADRSFSEVKSVANFAVKEASIRNRLKEFADFHIQQIVQDIMKQSNIDQKKWGKQLLEFVQLAVENVRPSSRYLNDSMNFNQFIKIKIINWHNNSKSAYINGIVISKNIADKRMKSKIDDPQILLLKESIGTIRGESSKEELTEIQSLVDQEEHWIEIIRQKLTQVRPSIIIVEKDVGYKVLDALREAGVTVITNLHKLKMKRIQRYTQTIISPSYNVIDKSFVLGKCKQFRVEAPFSGGQMARMQQDFQYNAQIQSDATGKYVSNDRSLIYFEGTNPGLGCTILLSGNVLLELEELKKVKQALREMLKLARNVILEKAFLLQLGCNIPKPVYDEKGQLNADESPFLINRNIQNRQIFVLSKVIMKKGIAQAPQITTQNIQSTPSITNNNMNNASQMFNPSKLEEEKDVTTHQDINFVSPQVLQMARAEAQSKVNENFVKTKIDSMCGCPKKEKLTFYQKEQKNQQISSQQNQRDNNKESDETLGKFLYKLSKMLINNCEHCKEPMFKHFIQYYHKDGCIEVQLEMKQILQPQVKIQSKEQKEEQEKKYKEIKMRGECQICKKQVSPEVTMTNTLFEYSKARFLEQFFYNGDKLFNYNSNYSCAHRSLKDINRIFIMPGGYQITFSFITLEVYQIEMIQPKKQNTRELFKIEIDNRKEKMFEFYKNAYAELKTKMQILLEFMNSEKRQYLSKDLEKKLISNNNSNIQLFLGPLKIIKQKLSPIDSSQEATFETDLTKMMTEIHQPIHEVKTIFEAMFLERKLLLNFMTYSTLLEETSKIVCLLLALLRLRMIVIQKQDQSINLSSYNNDISESTRTETIQEITKLGTSERTISQNVIKRDSRLLSDQEQQNQFKTEIGQMVGFNFIEDFITGHDLRQLQQQIQASQNPQQAHPTAKTVTQQMNTAQNIDSVKMFVNAQFLALYNQLQKIWGASSNDNFNFNSSDKQFNKFDEDEKGMQEGVSKTRESTVQQSLQKNMAAPSLQNLIQLNLQQMNDLGPSHTLQQQLQWQKQLKCGYVTMPLGADNMHIPLNDSNIGSILSFVLSSNIYKEAMIKQNYMDIGSKIKAPSKHQRQGLQTGASLDNQTQSSNNRESILGTSNNQFSTQVNNLNSNSAKQFQQYNHDEAIKLIGKDDVFNYDLSPHQIETELLCGERLYFQVKFSTENPDLQLKIVKNGQVTKLKSSSMQFVSGKTENASKKQIGDQSKKSKIKEEVIKNDLQEKICPTISKDYLDKNNLFFKDQMETLDNIVRCLNQAYFNIQPPQGKLISPERNIFTSAPNIDENHDIAMDSQQANLQNNPMSTPVQDTSATLGQQLMLAQQNTPSLRDSMIGGVKSSPILALNTPQLTSTSLMHSPQLAGVDPQEFCNVRSPQHEQLEKPFDQLRNQLRIPKVIYELKIFFPKKFEALRRFYCGSQQEFIESLIQTKDWTTVTGGKTKSKFHRSFDDKYVFKEIKKSEFKMFFEFAPQYFDYLCKSFFHNYPCALCKILGAFKIKITTFKNNQPKVVKKYIYVTENLNFGIKPEDEPHIVRYDLKGSTLNRFVKGNNERNKVLHDNNFQLAFMGRPFPIRYTINRILHICINNDTLCLSKSNIVDYSLLTIIDTKRKMVRFGIIDYVQQYTLDKIFEGQFKRIINRGEVPTIVDPDKYKIRFKRAMKRYFIGMAVQEEKSVQEAYNKQELLELQMQQMILEESNSEDEDELNETVNKSNLNDTLNAINSQQTAQKIIEEDVEHQKISENNNQIQPTSSLFQ